MNQVVDGEFWQRLLTHAPFGLVLVKASKVVYANPLMSAAEILPSEAQGLDISCLADFDQASIQAAGNDGLEWITFSRDGEQKFRVTAQPVETGGVDWAYFFNDITVEQRLAAGYAQVSRELEAKNTRDSVTGLLNQRGLTQVLESQVSRSRRYDNPLSLVAMQVVGSAADDQEVLSAVGCLLNDQLRWADMAGRFDDDRLLLVLPETSHEAASQLVTKLAQLLGELSLPSGVVTCVQVRCGVSSWHKGDDFNKLLDRASEAMVEVGFDQGVADVSQKTA